MSVPVTIVTGAVVALSAAASALTPIVMARRRARQDAIKFIKSSAVERADLTLASWTALNGALQTEITRLQKVVDRLQGRVDAAEVEIDSLRSTIRGMPGSGKNA
jgi:peptidoglycan hydrolase CwlO-like protein